MGDGRNMQGFTDGTVSDPARGTEREQTQSEARNKIALGMDMENFLRTDVGKYLSGRAEVEIAAFRTQLDDLDPEDSKNIRDIQQEIATRKVWKEWLYEAIQAGEVAQEDAIERNAL